MKKNTLWDDIVKVGFMGTDRVTPSVQTLEALQGLGIKNDELTEAVIEGAGVIAIMKKGAFPLKKHTKAIPQIAEPETKKPCSPTSIKHLKEILKGRYEGVFEEFLYHIHINDKILPPDTLPQIFHYCRGNMKLWAIVGNYIGNKGKWLLQQNPDWEHLLKENNFEIPTPHLHKESPQESLVTYGQYKKEETLIKAKEIIDFLQSNRLVWIDDRKVQMDLKDLAYKADLDLHDSLQNLFSNEVSYQWENKINDFFDTLRFRKNMILGLKS